jgi:hypothetical protein
MARAATSGITLGHRETRVVKGMLARGDRQHDIASYFGVNGGRIAENFFFLYYMGYCVAVRVLDRLDAITKRVGA